VNLREYFTIKTGLFYQDEPTEELIMYYQQQRICYAFMFVGAILVLFSIL